MSAAHNHPPSCCCDRITDPDGSRRIIWRCPGCSEHGDLACAAAATPHTEQETTKVEERPDDDPAPVATCNGRDCGGRPHA